MRKEHSVVLMAFMFMVLVYSQVASANLDKQKEALEAIADFADRICNKIPIAGNSESLELSGTGKVELNKLLKAIADLEIEGGAKYQKSKFNNVLQKDLATLLKDGSKCKLDVFKELKDKLLVTETPPSPPVVEGASKEKVLSLRSSLTSKRHELDLLRKEAQLNDERKARCEQNYRTGREMISSLRNTIKNLDKNRPDYKRTVARLKGQINMANKTMYIPECGRSLDKSIMKNKEDSQRLEREIDEIEFRIDFLMMG